ncbi:COG complex component COG2 [Penicillium bovifimosum]|uniref:Conserved oligomeric Golgi complex subunit 2 n=1 Tax=Penicillium bovifimosum TaxID=126998 RepID=A0A9W9HGG6_9EURO|nr:COG complex component COG2 [Penicillium bovifimosum]KAJ5146450.1 COG complex component COG2 [Penicillium bovifimosum]
MDGLQFGDSDSSSSDFDEDPSGLPFPEPLSRTSFLAPDFDPATFLASLTNRHQSLEDLRQELRGLEQSLNKELLDLVNENYQDFLSLGTALRGGEEKVEGVKVGVLSFQRDVTAIRDKVEARRKEVEELLNEKRRLRTNADIGKELLDYADRVEELEHRLMIADKSSPQEGVTPYDSDTESDLYSGESDDSDDDELADGSSGISLKRMKRHAQKFVYLTSIAARVGEKHPFLVAQQPRVAKIKSTVLLDLKNALEQATAAGAKQGNRDGRTMAILRLYDLMGEDVSAVAALKNLKL